MMHNADARTRRVGPLSSPVALRRATTLLALMLVTAACSSATVNTDFDPAVNFSTYRAYSWRNGTPVNNQLMDRRIVEVLRQMRERHRFIRGMVSWAGGNQVAVLYDRNPRFSGETKYPLKKMVSFALDAITSFSVVPLRLVTYLALLIISVALLAALTVFVVKLSHPDYFIPGFPATMLTIIFFGGVQLLALGVIGEYVGRMYESVKSRPIYVVEGIYQGGGESGAIRRQAADPAPASAAVPRL